MPKNEFMSNILILLIVFAMIFSIEYMLLSSVDYQAEMQQLEQAKLVNN